MVSLIDENYFRIVLQNLLDNAIIHNKHQVDIELGIIEKNGQQHITIKDNGKGIAPKWQSKIFDKYERATADTPGLGIGLHLCKQIVEGHEGKINLKSALGEGALFTIQIPTYGS